MEEERLLGAHQIGDVIAILQTSTRHLYDPDELLTVINKKTPLNPEIVGNR